MLDKDYRYPRWQNVVPDTSINGWKKVGFDEKLVADAIKQFRAEYKTENNGKGCRWSDSWVVQYNKVYFKMEQFYKFIKALKAFGRDSFYIYDCSRSAAVTDDDFTALIMPVLLLGNEEHWKVLDMSDYIKE